MTRRLRYALALFLFATVSFFGGFSYSVYSTPNAYIDIDVNPAVELAVNRFGRVVGVSSYNSDGEAVLRMTDVRHERYTQAIASILSSMAAQGYLEQDGLLSLTVQAATTAGEADIMDGLAAAVESILQAYHATTETEIFSISRQLKEYAHEHHVSPAKYLAITALQQVDPAASFSGCSQYSISELRHLVKEHGEEHYAEAPPADNEAIAPDDSDSNESPGKNGGGHHNGHH